MQTYPIIQDGSDPFAFEIDHVYLSRRTIARLLDKIEGGDRSSPGRALRFVGRHPHRVQMSGPRLHCYGAVRRQQSLLGWSEGWQRRRGGGCEHRADQAAFEGYKPLLPVQIFGDLGSSIPKLQRVVSRPVIIVGANGRLSVGFGRLGGRGQRRRLRVGGGNGRGTPDTSINGGQSTMKSSAAELWGSMKFAACIRLLAFLPGDRWMAG
jgi:hypothetical protein